MVAGSPPTIYVVDDEQMLLDLAEMILEPAGFQVCLFRDPQKALAEYIAAQSPPDVLVTDYAMAQNERHGSDPRMQARQPAAKNHPAQRHGGRRHLCRSRRSNRTISWPSHTKSTNWWR